MCPVQTVTYVSGRSACPVTVRNDILHHQVDYTPYEAIEVTG